MCQSPDRPEVVPGGPFGVVIAALLLSFLAGAASVAAADGDERSTQVKAPALEAWLDIMVRHGYTLEEMRLATGVDESVLQAALAARTAPTAGPGRAASEGRPIVLPYPGGRHPRAGFLDGAVDPRRDTKASVFLPWEGGGYVVLDLPEALWCQHGLLFLAHTHIPTMWDKAGVQLERGEWLRRQGGVLENRIALPNGVVLRAAILPQAAAVDMHLWIQNGSSETLTGLRTQICCLLKGAPGMDEQTNDNKRLLERTAGVVSRDGKHVLGLTWALAKPWANPPCPCLHSDPVFPDLPPGAESRLRGRLFLDEAASLEEAVTRRKAAGALDAAPGPQLYSLTRISAAAPHSAFTDLLRFQGRFLCAFREGEAHVSADGRVAVLESTDGETWTEAARWGSPEGDLRDPKLSLGPRGKAVLTAAAAYPTGAAHRHQTLAWTSSDGRQWDGPLRIGEPDSWLWRITWRGEEAFGIGYSTAREGIVRLYRGSKDLAFETVQDRIFSEGSPNEATLLFEANGDARCLLRRDDAGGNGQVGLARPPYTDWAWKDLGARIGGPNWLRLPDGRYVAAVRLHDGGVRTGLCWIDPTEGTLREFLTLPSGGDTSYAGLLWHEGLLWVSYYSSHEGRTGIYLARVAF